MIKKFTYILFLFPAVFFAQQTETEQDTTSYDYIIIKGDSIPRTTIDLDEVMLLHKLEFNSAEDKRRYLILKRKTIKVYPYATLAAVRLDSLNARLSRYEKKSDRKRYAKLMQKYIEGAYLIPYSEFPPL